MQRSSPSRTLWNRLHQQFWGNRFRGSERHTRFAYETARRLKAPSTVLEVGFGGGSDALFFAKSGHQVVATDISDYAAEHCHRSYGSKGIEFIQHDTLAPFPCQDKQFDAVYARLSLHYFRSAETAAVIRELARVLRPGGLLSFMVKSVKDPMYGVGDLIEDDTYLASGEQRHFFSSEYTFDLLTREGLFDIEYIRYRSIRVYGKRSGVLVVNARRSGKGSQLLLF